MLKTLCLLLLCTTSYSNEIKLFPFPEKVEDSVYESVGGVVSVPVDVYGNAKIPLGMVIDFKLSLLTTKAHSYSLSHDNNYHLASSDFFTVLEQSRDNYVYGSISNVAIPVIKDELKFLTGKEPVTERRKLVKKIIYHMGFKSDTLCGKSVVTDYSELLSFLEIVRKESTYNPYCKNPSSSSAGLSGFLSSTWKMVKMKKTLSPFGQIEAMFRYIDIVYGGSPSKALRFHKSRGWY